jgi:hypothetical protein
VEVISRRLADQSGVISRRQLFASGYGPHDVRRLVRRRDLTPIALGVYVTHTGAPAWIEKAWAAVLSVSGCVEPTDAALAHWSALRIAEGPGRRAAHESPIHVAIPIARRARGSVDVVIHRMEHFEHRLDARSFPPRIRYEEAVLDVAADLPPLDAVGVLTRAVGERRSTALRLLVASRSRSRIPQRAWLESVLADVDQGTQSVLEHAFVDRVCRPHRLPIPQRQQREETPTGTVYRDAAYVSTLIELDGRLHGDTRDADLDRDLQAAASGRSTVRLGWRQVVGTPCQTAAALSRVLASGRSCGPLCAADAEWWKPGVTE